MAVVIALIITPLLILTSEKLMTPGRDVSALPSFFMSGLLPLILLLVISTVHLVLDRLYGLDHDQCLVPGKRYDPDGALANSGI